MESLLVEQTTQTPRIAFDAMTGNGEIVGTSFPEYANDFYACVYEWVDQYFAERPDAPLHVSFNLNYFNTAANKEVRLMMRHLERHFNEDKNVRITWFHEAEDDDMEDIGKYYSVNLSAPVSVETL